MNIAPYVRQMALVAGFLPAPAVPATLPVTFIGGGRSDYISAHHQAAIPRYFSNARIHILADAGHWVHTEQAARFHGIVKEHLQRTLA